MIKENRIKNNYRNTSYYKSKIEKTKKKKNNFFERSRKRQVSSYIRAVAVVAVFMLVITGFIMLGVFLKNLTAEEPAEPVAVRMTENPELGYAIPGEEPEGEPGYNIFYNFRGAYLDIKKLADMQDLQDFINIIKSRDINAVIIDIKKDNGVIPFRVNGQFTAVVGEHNKTELRIQDILAELRASDIYISGMIACFKDELAGMFFPDYALSEAETGVRFVDASGSLWLNIYSQGARDYILELAAECAQFGFDEIILDYYYLPDSSRLAYDDGGISRADIIKGFILDIRAVLSGINPDIKLGLEYNITGIDAAELINLSDFYVANFDVPDEPDINAYDIIKAHGEKYAHISGRLRPYIQAYNGDILSQRQALRDSGILVWTLVNYDNNY